MSKQYNNSIKQLRNRIIHASPQRKIILGAGDVWYGPDWIATNQEDLDILEGEDWQFVMGNTQADCICAEHVWEHFTPDQAFRGIQNVFNFLKAGGTFRIAVPDGNFPDQQYIDAVKPGGHGAGADDHQVLYTHGTIFHLMNQFPFKYIHMLEYWDAHGVFHYTEHDERLGRIDRSLYNDERNEGGTKKVYTSLIVDCIK